MKHAISKPMQETGSGASRRTGSQAGPVCWVLEAKMSLAAAGNAFAVSQACEQLGNWLQSMGLAAERAAEWRLVLAEAGSNAYENARQEARGMPVRFDVRCCPTAVEAVVTDRTAGFEWPAEAQLPPPDALRGRGLYLIRQLTDEARYERGEETNRLVLVRRGGPAMGCGDGWRESGL